MKGKEELEVQGVCIREVRGSLAEKVTVKQRPKGGEEGARERSGERTS